MAKRKIYDIKINGNSITYFQRTQGQTGRDIAAIKLALGDVYYAPLQNNSPDDTTTGQAWFSCDTSNEISIERLLTFDKKLKSSLMAFQIKHQLLVFAYYFEKYYAKNIKTEDEESLLQQTTFMINAFDIEFGTIGEATIAILHGYRPGANATNSGFVSSEQYPLDIIPKSLYDSYIGGEMESLPATILDSVFSREEADYSQMKDAWSLAASMLRRWETKLPTVEVAYVKYIAHSYVGNPKESDLLVATREMLQFVEDPKFTQDLSPSQRQSLVSRAFEPDPLMDPDPFVVSIDKVGFFDRTDYTFRNLPEFENLQQDARQQLELSALNKVLQFYKKQQVQQILDPEIVDFIDFRAPSLRPGDVYRAYFELDKGLIDAMPIATAGLSTPTTEATNQSASDEMERIHKEISELYCADGSTPNVEEARIQYERYRSFAAKKKLEITRKIRQTILENQEQDLTIDGVEFDLGVFGKGSLSENDIQNLVAFAGNTIIGGASSLTGQGIDWMMGNSDAGGTSQTIGNSLVINYNTLVEYIDKVSENFEKAQEDLTNFELEGDPYFLAIEEANKLRSIPTELLTLLGGDISFSAQLESRGTDMDAYIGNDNTFITFTFSDVPIGSRIVKVQIKSDTVEPTSAFTNFAATEIAEAITTGQNRLAPQEGNLNGSMRRYRTVHYLRNIEDLADKSSSVANFFNKLANPDSTCDTDESGTKVGTGAEYILRHTKGITKSKKPSDFNPIHNWRNPSGKKAIQNIKKHGKSVLDRKDKEYYGFIETGVEMEKVFGFEEVLPQLGPPIDTTTFDSANKALGMKLLQELSSLLDYKRIMCEYAACLGVPDVQVSIPDLSLPEWPKIPMMSLPGSDWKEKLYKMMKDIFYRALYTFLKGIIDILKTPFCSEKFIEDLYGAASDTSPIIKKALGDGLLDTGIPIQKSQNAKDLIDALLGLLTPSELCALLNGDVVNDSVYHIVRATATAFGLTQELETEEQISNFFITLGLFVGPEICDNLNRYNNVQETCEDVYSIVGQMRNAILKGESVTQAQLNQASTAAQEEFDKKRDALNFLAGEGGLADLLPDFTALENNPIFSVPSEFVLDSAKLAANSVLSLSKTAFVRSLNSFVSSFYVDEQRLARPGDDLYEAAANMTIQRATCNLQRFANFSNSRQFDINNLASRTATDSLRKALIILSDDYEKVNVEEATVPYQIYTLNEADEASGANRSLLKSPLSEKYPIYDVDRSQAATLSLSSNIELAKNWEYLFPISAGDLGEVTRTISNFDNWHNPVFRGEGISATDVLSLNTNYLNKMNQIVSRLQQDITSNIEKAFRITPESKFLSVIGTFYEIEEEADQDLRALNINQYGKELIDVGDYATSITLNHPVLASEQASVKFQDDKRMVGDKVHVLTQVSLEDDFFYGTDNKPKIFTTCDPLPESLEGLFSGASSYRRDVKKTLFYEFFKKMFNGYLNEYSTDDVYVNEDTADELLKLEFQEVNEGLIEQIVSAVRESRIFNDPAYLNRIDSKLRSRFYYDPVTKCFKNPNNSIKFGVFNYEKIVTEEFEKQYKREYARPENSDLLRDYNKPGAFQKALMNTSVLGFIRIALIDLLLKGSISFSVWGFDSLKSSKLFREYIVSFVENQLNQEEFFASNREMLDETLIRLAGINNIASAIRKLTLREVDTMISDLSTKLFETESVSGTETWFLDHIPLVGVPDNKASAGFLSTRLSSQMEDLWVSNLRLEEINKFRKNSFSFLEEYVRVRGPLRNFESSYSQIAAAQYNQLQARLQDIGRIVRNTNLEFPDLPIERIASASAIDINIQGDNDQWPNKEVLSVNEFSEVIRSLLDNNKELSKYFHQLQNKIYEPNNILKHGAPETLEDIFPHRPIVRTRKRYEFSQANAFSALFSPASEIHFSSDIHRAGNYDGAQAAIARHVTRTLKQDKFRIQNKINIQPKDSAYYWAIINGASNLSTGISVDLNESSVSSVLRKSLNSTEEYEDRYYIAPITLEKALGQYEEQVRFSSEDTPDLNYLGRRPTSAMAVPVDLSIEGPDGLLTDHPSSRRKGIQPYNYLKESTLGNLDDEGKHAIHQRTENRLGATVTETLFKNLGNKVSKQQFDFALSSSSEPEYWEETIIDLVGAASPIFNQPGEAFSSLDLKDDWSDAQKTELGAKLNRAKYWLGTSYRQHLEKSVPNLVDNNKDKFLFAVTTDPDDSSKIQKARLCNHFRHIVHDQDDYGWDRDHTYTNMEFPGCFDLAYASNKGIKYNKVSGRASPKVFEIDQPHELLGPNDYKIPLRIMITQIKSASGEILQVFVKYIIPEFCDFSNATGGSDTNESRSSLRQYRAAALLKACKQTFDAYEHFMEDTVYDMLEELAVIDRDKYDHYRYRLYDDGVINRRRLKPSYAVQELIRYMTPSGNGVQRAAPPFRYPGTSDDNDMANLFDNSNAAAWMNHSKFYSIAAQNEAEDKIRNFQTSQSFLDKQFKSPGALVKKPQTGLSKQEFPPEINATAWPHYKMQEHYLYEESMRDLLDPISGRSTKLIDKSNEKCMQTIGNFVNWFNQRRIDSFFGYTTSARGKIKTTKEFMRTKIDIYAAADPSLVAGPRQRVRGGGLSLGLPSDEAAEYSRSSNETLQNFMQFHTEGNFSTLETSNDECGPSLFTHDERSSLLALWAAIQTIKLEMTYYTNRIDAAVDMLINTYNGNIRGLSNPYAFFEMKSYEFNMSNRLRPVGSMAVIDYYYDTRYRDSRSLPTDRLVVGGTVNEITTTMSLEDFKKTGLYVTPSSVLHSVSNFDYTPSIIYEDTVRDYFKNTIEQEFKREISYPTIIANITAQYNAALEEIGIMEIIRDVTTRYVSRLEGDASIVLDILADSEISHGIRIMQGNPYRGINHVDTMITDKWLHDSKVSEEERMGVVLIGDKQYRTYPVSSFEQPLASLDCFMAATPLQFREKLKEQLPYMKCKLQSQESFVNFFDFIVPYKIYSSMLAMHGITLLSGYGDMPTIMDSAKSGLAGAFSQAAMVDPTGDSDFAVDFDNSDLIAAFGTPGPVGGQSIDCFDPPNMRQWWKLIKEMLKQYVKYFPSVILRGIADSIDPAYKEMKRHYLSCELPDLTNKSWGASSGAGNIPLGLRGGQRGNKDSIYAPLIPAFPVDVVKGVMDFPDPEYLLKSVDKLVGYIYGGQLPLLDPTYAFKIPCLEIDQTSPESWSQFNVGNSGRYGQPLNILTLLALSTYQLPNDLEMRRSICNREDIDIVVACDDEQEED